MSNIVIADVAIRTDAEGRYCLNDLHRAAGGGKRHQPSNWLQSQQTQDLVAEVSRSCNSRNERNQPVSVVQGGNGLQGTFAVRELVYAFATWISPAFHLKVIRAYDQLMTATVNLVPQSLPDALRLAADLAEQKAQAEAALALAAPKVAALNRIAAADGSLCITDAAKALQVPPRALFAFLQSQGWIFRRPGSGSWLAYQSRIQQGLLEHKVTTVERGAGAVKVVEAVRVTAKGLARLAEALGQTALNAA
jgi:phage antirepressor YoqD-like protein